MGNLVFSDINKDAVINLYEIKKEIIPQFLIYNNKKYKINYFLDEHKNNHIIKNYYVYLFNKKLMSIFLPYFHPNCDPSTGVFCLPPNLLNLIFNKDIQEYIEKEVLPIYNYDNCYFKEWNIFDYST